MTDFILHVFLFAGVMLVLGLIAMLAGSWGWFLAAFFGWGIVLFGQAAYVFVFKRATTGQAEEDRVIEEMAEDTAKVVPGA